jgi:hypothetical protein
MENLYSDCELRLWVACADCVLRVKRMRERNCRETSTSVHGTAAASIGIISFRLAPNSPDKEQCQ